LPDLIRREATNRKAVLITGTAFYFADPNGTCGAGNKCIHFWNKSWSMKLTQTECNCPLKSKQEGNVALLQIVSNKKWREYNMKYPVITITLTACLFSSLAFGGDTFTLDPNTSSARFFQGSKANPDSVNTGVARVTGTVNLDTNAPDDSAFDLSIYPADEDWGNALTSDGILPTSYVPDTTDQTLLTFRSTRIMKTGNGKLQVIGELTLTRVKRTVEATPTEAYAGQMYSNPVIYDETREITFLFPGLSAALPSGSLITAALQNRGAQEIVGSAHIGHEDFPELLDSIKETNWPSVIQNKDCPMSAIGEAYSGARCTGTLIAATSHDNCRAPASVGEDYSGLQCAAATGNQTTIVLDLKFVHTATEPPARIVYVPATTVGNR
jgi:polyisoprenoid-binding protein YceI